MSRREFWDPNDVCETEREILTDACNEYRLQCDASSQAILEDRDVPTPLEDALANMIVIDAVRRSSAIGEWIHIPQVI